jgi:uncharacterized protein YggT (Ycf19 family)
MGQKRGSIDEMAEQDKPLHRDADGEPRTTDSREATESREPAMAVRADDRPRELTGRERKVARAQQVVGYLFYLIYSLIILQIVLELLAARPESGFKQFMDMVTAPLLGPFEGLMEDPSYAGYTLRFSYITALLVYALLHAAIKGLLRFFLPPPPRL